MGQTVGELRISRIRWSETAALTKMADIKVSSYKVELELRVEHLAYSCPGVLCVLDTSPLEECRLRVDPRSGRCIVARQLWLVVVLELLEQSQQRESTAIPSMSVYLS